MKANIEKLKKATKNELVDEIDLIDREISNQMYPVSYARYKELDEYKKEIEAELATR